MERKLTEESCQKKGKLPKTEKGNGSDKMPGRGKYVVKIAQEKWHCHE